MTRSKAYRNSTKDIDLEKVYSFAEAIKLLRKTSTVKFDATAEIHYRLGIDPRHADQQIRTTISLPHGTGKTARVVVFCEEEDIKKAKAAGATDAGGEELIDKIVKKGWTDFDIAVSTPSMMKSLAKAARVLGPKGLMPNPKSGTVSPDVEKTVKEVMGGRIEFRNDKHGIIHSQFGKVSFTDEQLLENLETFHKAVQEAKPAGQKGIYFKNVTICSTMGAGVQLEVGEE